MSDETYMAKEEARANLRSALEEYMKAAIEDDLSQEDAVNEMNDIFFELGSGLRVVGAP